MPNSQLSNTFLKLVNFVVIGGAITWSGNCAHAQVTPDGTLGTESSVLTPTNVNGLPGSQIDGGATRGSNLFHSFEQFSIPTGGEAFFNNALDIQNIISRVTSLSISDIDGLIRANGTANMFLLNPNGIIFGSNARLNIGGSFVGSTASSLNFLDGTQFSASVHQTMPLLTISVPIGLQFGSNPGRILVQGNGEGLRTTSELVDTTVGLRVQPDQTLAMVGGDLAILGGTLKTAGGRIELGSVAGFSLVNLTPIDSGWALGYEGVSSFGNIQLSQQATIDVSGAGGGNVEVRGAHLALTGSSRIESNTLREESGGTLSITTSDSVKLIGRLSGLSTTVFPEATGSGSNLILETGQLLVRDGAQINGGTTGTGNAGTLVVRASDLVEVIGTTGADPSGLYTEVKSKAIGSGGNLTIETGRLIVRDGAQIFAGTYGKGAAGSLTISARDSVELIGTSPLNSQLNNRLGSSLATLVGVGATGAGGNLTLETGRLSLQNGALVSTATFGAQPGGSLSIRAKEVELMGTPPDGLLPTRLSARSLGSGNSGDLKIETGQLTIQDRAQVTTRNDRSGNAGNIQIKANSINLNNRGGIIASTAAGESGNLLFQTENLLLRRGSFITATAGGTGNGGNISINTDTLAALENSDITANAFEGQGGNIQINTQGIFRSLDSDITATSQLGINGVVEISTADIDFQNSLTELATNFVTTDQVIAGSCLARRNQEQGTFVITGNGGLPINPYSGIEEWDTLTGPQRNEGDSVVQQQQQQQPVQIQKTEPISTKWKLGDPIVEAQGIVKTADGRTLVTTLPQKAASPDASKLVCPSN